MPGRGTRRSIAPRSCFSGGISRSGATAVTPDGFKHIVCSGSIGAALPYGIYIGWQKLLQLKGLKIPGTGSPVGILLSGGGVAWRLFCILGVFLLLFYWKQLV